jgi:tetratricopeptide (TPR) repeat protein
MEENLLENRTRVRLPKGIVLKYVASETLIKKLLATRLIKMETDTNGAIYYEISHDSLVDPILNAKQIREQLQQKEQEHQKALEEIERTRQQRIAEAEQLRLDYYKLLEQNDLVSAVETLKKSLSIFEELEILKSTVELRLLLVKALAASGCFDESTQMLDATLQLTKEKNDLALEGKVYENYASFYEDKEDDHQSVLNYEKALSIYRSISDFPQIGRLAEHMGGYNEQKYDSVIDEGYREDKKEDIIMDSYNFYQEALSSYELIRETFGIKRVQRSMERVRKFAHSWGYLTDLLTGTIHTLKGKANIRIGRDVYDEETGTYQLKNEIGFPAASKFISRRHASITPDLVIEDMQSLNGTTVNTLPLYYGNPRILRDRDLIIIANVMPLMFTLSEPQPHRLPDNCWGILITNTPYEIHYVSGNEEIAVSVLKSDEANMYETKVEKGINEDALIRFKLIDNLPFFLAAEKMTVLNDSTGTFMTWKIRTTMKNTDRIYEDYILNTGEWLRALDSPLQPQLTPITDNKEDSDKILLPDVHFQFIFVADYNKE